MRGAPHNGLSLLFCWMSSRNSRLLWVSGVDREISSANRPEILSDASAEWCRAEPREPIRSGISDFFILDTTQVAAVIYTIVPGRRSFLLVIHRQSTGEIVMRPLLGLS
jgi:hypothetical protein